MLDMGFIDPIRRIIAALPRKRQNLMFSATMPPDIATLADKILINPVKLAVTPVATTAENVEQWVLFVERGDKRALLGEVLRDPAMTRVLVFTRTKHGANRVAEQLDRGGVGAEAIHGNKSQGARQRALEGFKNGRLRVLVATDIAARGIDVDGITHVVNFELPNEPESYVHRIGRTARAGAAGRRAVVLRRRRARLPARHRTPHPHAGARSRGGEKSEKGRARGGRRPGGRPPGPGGGGPPPGGRAGGGRGPAGRRGGGGPGGAPSPPAW